MVNKNITTLWQNQAGVNEKYVNMALVKKTGLRLTYKNEIMDIPPEAVKNGHSSVETFQDKFIQGKTYKLYYYRWKPTVRIEDGTAKMINQTLL